MDGSSRLIYYLIKRARHRRWTASGRSELTSMGEEEGRAPASPWDRPPPWTLRSFSSPILGSRHCSQYHLGRISLPRVSQAPEAVRLLPSSAAAPAESFLLMYPSPNYCCCPSSTPCIRARVQTLHDEASGLLLCPQTLLQDATLNCSLGPKDPTPPPGVPFAASAFILGYRGHLAAPKCTQPIDVCFISPTLMPFLTFVCLTSDGSEHLVPTHLLFQYFWEGLRSSPVTVLGGQVSQAALEASCRQISIIIHRHRCIVVGLGIAMQCDKRSFCYERGPMRLPPNRNAALGSSRDKFITCHSRAALSQGKHGRYSRRGNPIIPRGAMLAEPLEIRVPINTKVG